MDCSVVYLSINNEYRYKDLKNYRNTQSCSRNTKMKSEWSIFCFFEIWIIWIWACTVLLNKHIFHFCILYFTIYSIKCPVLQELLILFIQTKNFTIEVVNFLLMLSYLHMIQLTLDGTSNIFPYYMSSYVESEQHSG